MRSCYKFAPKTIRTKSQWYLDDLEGKKCFGLANKHTPTLKVLRSAKMEVQQWKNSLNSAANFTAMNDAAIWSCPPDGILKINVDGALFSDQQRYRFSCVARNHNGVVHLL